MLRVLIWVEEETHFDEVVVAELYLENKVAVELSLVRDLRVELVVNFKAQLGLVIHLCINQLVLGTACAIGAVSSRVLGKSRI